MPEIDDENDAISHVAIPGFVFERVVENDATPFSPSARLAADGKPAIVRNVDSEMAAHAHVRRTAMGRDVRRCRQTREIREAGWPPYDPRCIEDRRRQGTAYAHVRIDEAAFEKERDVPATAARDRFALRRELGVGQRAQLAQQRRRVRLELAHECERRGVVKRLRGQTRIRTEPTSHVRGRAAEARHVGRETVGKRGHLTGFHRGKREVPLMIVEMRTYTLVPGTTGTYFELYEREGLATQREHLGEMLGYYATEVGHVNQVVHMWQYPSFEERMTRRNALKADPRWKAYLVKMLPMLLDQDSKILLPAPFFALSPR